MREERGQKIIQDYEMDSLVGTHSSFSLESVSFYLSHRLSNWRCPARASMQKFTSCSPFSPSQLLLADLKGSVIVLRERKPSLRSPWLSHKAKEESLRCVS